MKTALIIPALILTSQAFAQKPVVTTQEKAQQKSAQVAQSSEDLLALKIAKGAAIEIDNYDADSDTFEIVIVKEPGVGPNVTTLDYLQVATAGAALPKGTSQKKSDMLGAEYTLKEDLILLSEKEVQKRTKRK